MIQAFLARQAWKLISGGAVILSAVLGVALVSAKLENRTLSSSLIAADRVINAPGTGLRDQLAQARSNVATLKWTIDVQNDAIREKAEQDADRLAAAERKLSSALDENRRLGKRVSIMLDPPKGATLEDRIQDVDRRFLETLK